MRKFIGSILLFSATAFFLTSGGYSQKGKGGFKGGGFDFFGKLAGDKPYIDLATTQSRMKDSLIEYAQAKGISDGKITREQFAGFNDFMKEKYAGGGGGPKKGGPPSGSNPSVVIKQKDPAPDPIEAWNKFAEVEFKKLDLNNDDILVKEEMPKPLLDQLEKWDKDKNGKIDLPEFKAYYIARMQESLGKDFSKWNPSANPVATIIIEEDWDKRPVVLRAGFLHKDLPKWFAELDTSPRDGQVSLAEWLKAKKEYDLFKKYDRNDDGLLTQEEVLYYETVAKTKKESKDNPSLVSNFGSTGSASQATGEEKKKGGYDFSKYKKKKS